MPLLEPEQHEHIETIWRKKWEFILQAQSQIVNWLFAVHGGGIAGMLSYAASKGPSCYLKIGLGAFSLGLVLIILFGVFLLYWEENHFIKFRRDVDKLYRRETDWLEFLNREAKRPDKYRSCEILAWLSGICGVTGVIMAVLAIV